MQLRDAGLLGLRLTVGGYLAGHAAQKLFGKFGGHGPEGTGQHFEQLGLSPGKQMAELAGGTELTGGALTVLGLGGPVGPAMIASAMAVAMGTAHRGKGPFAMTGGPELPLVDIASALALAATGPGSLSLDRLFRVRIPTKLSAAVVIGGAALSALLITQASARQRAAQQAASTPPTEPVAATDLEQAINPPSDVAPIGS